MIQPKQVAALAPTLAALEDLTQSSGSYVVRDNLLATATTPDDVDGHTTTGVNLYESGNLVGAMVQGPSGTWKRTVSSVTTGAKSYVARRVFAEGTTDSPAVTFTVLGVLAPDQITTATLLTWVRCPESIQIGTTPEPTGSTPPAITFSSVSGLVRTEQIKITVPTGGARGTAKLNVFLNDMTTPLMSNVTTAATITITGTDIVINCPASTYNVNNVYRSVINPLLDKVGAYPSSTNNFANVTAGTRPYNIAAQNSNLGTACARFDGTNDLTVNTGSLGTSWAGGTDQAFYAIGLVDFLSLPTGGNAGTIYCASNITDTDLPRVTVGAAGPTFDSPWRAVRSSDTGSATTADSAVQTSTGQALFEDMFDGTNRTMRVNGADVIGGDSGVSGAMGGKTITTTRVALGCRVDQSGSSGVAGTFGNFDLYELAFFNQAPSAVEQAQMKAYFFT
jgi:hypothetical protein